MKTGFNLLLWTTHVTEEHLHALRVAEESERSLLSTLAERFHEANG